MSNSKKAIFVGLALSSQVACLPGGVSYKSSYKKGQAYKTDTKDQVPVEIPPPRNNDVFITSPISDSDLLTEIDDAVSKLNPNEAKKTRFFSLQIVNNLGVGADVLEQQRKAFVKTLNSLSTKSALVKPIAVDSAKLIYRVNLDDLGMSPAEFDSVIADHYPFNQQFLNNGTSEGISNESNDASIRKLLVADIAIIRMDWFNATAMLPIPYAKFMRYPNNLADFENAFLGDSIASNVQADDVIRSGFDNSAVAASNRVVERHDGKNGGFYVTYDFINLKVGDRFTNNQGQNRVANQADVDRHNINLRPLGPLGTGGGNLEFAQDQNEIMFVLPNGMFGFFMANSQGQAIDKSPLNLIRHNEAPAEFSLAAVNGQSCLSCHGQGLLLSNDTILSGISANRNLFNAGDLSRINRIYQPTAYSDEVQQDNAKYLKILGEMGIDPAKADPVDATYRFYNRPMTKKDVLTELNIAEKDFNLLFFDPEFSGTLNALNNPTGTITRAVFQSIYPKIVTKVKQEIKLVPPAQADFVVTADCMADDLEQMDTCVIAPGQ